MCRLFGLYANIPVDVEFSFYHAENSMAQLSHYNYSGWGIAWFNGVKWELVKEPSALHVSKKARSTARRVRGLIIISHVRLATTGGETLENTHPWLYRGYVFAHNGTVDRWDLLRLVRHEYRGFEGETDSEVLFHLIVQEALDAGGFLEGVRRALEKINGEEVGYSSLNFLASDGHQLYALRYAKHSLEYYTLYYLERPMGPLSLNKLSETTLQLIRAKLAHGERAVLVASEPLTEENWLEIPNKHMLIVDKDLSVKLIEMP
ncbi:MAG: class II glutamine amidotransferase [Thermosphaera sp.]|nr:class II glutamine amidotransferase [Thermosphaera sp.]